MSSSCQCEIVERRARRLIADSDQVCCGGCLEFISPGDVADVRVSVPAPGLTRGLMIGYAVCADCVQRKKPSAVERRVRRMCKLPESVGHMRAAMLHRYALGMFCDMPAEIMPQYV